jgi:hypothetical protein
MGCCSSHEANDMSSYNLAQQNAMVNAEQLTTAFQELEHAMYTSVMFSLAFRKDIKRHARPQIVRILAVKGVVRHILRALPCRIEAIGNGIRVRATA